MWRKKSIVEGQPEIWQWITDDRTASIAERYTVVAADAVSGSVHLTYQYPNGETSTIVYPPAVARSMGAVLIEAGLIAGSDINR